MPLIVGRGIFATDPFGDGGTGYEILGDAVNDLCNACHGTAATLRVLKKHFFNNLLWPDFTEIPNKTRPTLR